MRLLTKVAGLALLVAVFALPSGALAAPGPIELVSKSPEEQMEYAVTPALSANGRYVAFTSKATNVVQGVTHAGEVYVTDTQTGATALLSRSTSGAFVLLRPIRAKVRTQPWWRGWIGRKVRGSVTSLPFRDPTSTFVRLPRPEAAWASLARTQGNEARGAHLSA